MKNLHHALERYRAITIFLTLVLLISVIFVAICVSARTVFRQNANDPQVEVTDQVASIVRQGVPLDAIVSGAEQIDLATSKALFVVVYDGDRNLVGSSATFNGDNPQIPGDALDKAKQAEDYRFDWQPDNGLKFGLVAKAIDDQAFVVAGRSLTEMENRAAALHLPLWIGWVAAVLVALLLTALIRPLRSIAIVEETNVTVIEEQAD